MPLRRMVDVDSSFSHHLQQTQTAFLDAFDHQDFSYGAIVRSSSCRVWVNGEEARPETSVAVDDEVAVLPPVSGGYG